jgi:threonine/homoserine/homoserine lactone efflux protein
LGITTFRFPAPVKPDFEGEALSVQPSSLTAFVVGFLTNLLNPKAVLFFLALFSTIVSADTLAAHKIVYVGTMSAQLFIWFLLVSVFFTTPSVRGAFYKIGKWFNRITGAALVLLAVRVAASRQ